jgi:hypothetical protein
MGLAKRRLYKPDRRPARAKGVLGKHSVEKMAPVGCLDATEGEVAKALFVLARQSGVTVGRGSGYDPLRDIYTVIGKSASTGKVQDFDIEGGVVAELIRVARILNGGRMDRCGLL